MKPKLSPKNNLALNKVPVNRLLFLIIFFTVGLSVSVFKK
ncbi:hypothetical protein KUC_0468 [Vreelandella boliviensis LC1]|uniref:Uncharacterized protein n=1 Tax=Vreelandella boliviensis LC1 TaxID=1072583 RepID=A0A7U9C5H6_9GAMM|nr:hypothetical protein KUC_0468 [Halomonas boliviensis LC1]